MTLELSTWRLWVAQRPWSNCEVSTMDFVQVAYDYVDTDHKIVDEFDELVAMCFMVMVAFEN